MLPLPQAAGMVKHRPAIVLREMPPYRDVLVCGVSTQLRQAAKDFDEVISPSDADFVASGLLNQTTKDWANMNSYPRNHTKQHERKQPTFRVASCGFVDKYFSFSVPILRVSI